MMTEHIDDYVYDIECPSLDDRVHGFEDDDFDLSSGSPRSPKSPTKKDALLVGFLLPTLTPSNSVQSQSSKEKEGSLADANDTSGGRRRQVPSLNEAHPDAGTTKPKTKTGVKDILPALKKKRSRKIPRNTLGLDSCHATSPRTVIATPTTCGSKEKASSGKKDSNAPIISKYNSLTQYEIDLKETDWIEVNIRDFKTGEEVMCRLITPDLCIQYVREELHVIGGVIDCPTSSSILRLTDEHTVWKTNGNGGGGNCSKKDDPVKQEGLKFGPDGFWGRRKGHTEIGKGEQQSRCLPSIPDEATLAEAYLETKPPKAIVSLHVTQNSFQTSSESSAGEIGKLRQTTSEGSSRSEKNVNRLLEMRHRPHYSEGAMLESPKSKHGAHTQIITDVKEDVAAVEKERRTLFLLWEHTTTDDDYENALLFAQRVCPTVITSSSAIENATTDNSAAAMIRRGSPMDSPRSTSVHTLDVPEEGAVEPDCEPPPVLKPKGGAIEPDCGPPPPISKYVRVRNKFLANKPRRSFSEVAKRFSLPRLPVLFGAGKLADEDAKGHGGKGGGGAPLSSSGAKTASVLKGMATWRPSGARALSMATLSNEEESSRRVLLAEDMRQWEGLSLMEGRVTRLHISGCSPSLQGSAVLGPEVGRMSELQHINLNKNKLSGPLPLLKCLGRLSNLRQLSISNNHISGSLKNISVLKHLADLDLSRNALTGSIPEELGSLRGLMSLNLSHNKLAGTIPPEMSELSKLCVLNLSNNLLFGHIDNWIGSFKNLQRINLAHNQLEGSLPTGLYRLPSLEYLHLHDNQFHGDFPIDVLLNLNPEIREIMLHLNAFHSPGGSNPGTQKKKKKKPPALLKEEVEDAFQVAADVAALLVNYKQILEDIYHQCTIVI